MAKLIRQPPNEAALDKLREIYLLAESNIIREIGRLRSRGLVDYHAVAALERIQKILQTMIDDCWTYTPRMVEQQFYVRVPEARKILEPVEKHIAGYQNAQVLTSTQMSIVDTLVTNLMAEVTEAAQTAQARLQDILIGPLDDRTRTTALEFAAQTAAEGKGVYKALPEFVAALRRDGVIAFTDRAGRDWSLHTYCSMCARTTYRQAETLAVITAEESHDLYQISSHGATCGLCAPFEGRVYSRSGTDPDFPPLSVAFGKVDPNGTDDLTNTYLNIHPNCLVPGGTVLAEGVMAHSCREYDGPVITLVTSKGNRITVTPNHPILTTEGFVPAGMLKENQKIIETTGEYRLLLREAPDNINVPTLIENIGHSIIQTCGGTTIRVKGSSVQFHGDGISDSEVDVVLPQRFRVRKRDILRCKPVREECLPSTHLGRIFFLSKRTLFQILNRAFHTANGTMSRLGFEVGVEAIPIEGKQATDVGKGTTAFRGDLRKSKPFLMQRQKLLKLFRPSLYVSGRHIKKLFPFLSGKKTMVNHSTPDGVFGYAEMLSHLRVSDPMAAEGLQRLLRQNVLVISDLVHVNTSEYHGKVYNLQTKYGFYTYNNIVTHNCLHVILPWTPAGRTPEEIQKIKDFSNPEKNPFSVDPRTKKQIEAYRKKEKARAQWLRDYRQWERYQITLGDKFPKTFETFLKHKYAGKKRTGDEKYRKWLQEYRRANRKA